MDQILMLINQLITNKEFSNNQTVLLHVLFEPTKTDQVIPALKEIFDKLANPDTLINKSVTPF